MTFLKAVEFLYELGQDVNCGQFDGTACDPRRGQSGIGRHREVPGVEGRET